MRNLGNKSYRRREHETIEAGLKEGYSLRIKRAHQEPRRVNRKKPTPRHSKDSITKDLKIIVQASIEGYLQKNKNSIDISFLSASLDARRQ